MMNRKKLRAALCGTLALIGLTALGAAAGGAGSQSDPLVTLSYLNETFTTQVMDMVDKAIKERNAELTQNPAPSNTAYAVVELAAGECLLGYAGCEVLPRSGKVMCGASSSPGLVDSTSGNTLDGGSFLQINHLYLMTDSRTVTAEKASVLLVRGEYAVQQGRG